MPEGEPSDGHAPHDARNEAVPDATGTTLHQTAVFDPIGLWGLLYWYSLVPVHGFIFGGMLRGIAQRIEPSSARAGVPAPAAR